MNVFNFERDKTILNFDLNDVCRRRNVILKTIENFDIKMKKINKKNIKKRVFDDAKN